MRKYRPILSLVCLLLIAVMSACNRNNTATENATLAPAVVSGNAVSSPLTALNDLGVVPDFSFTDQQGRTVTLADLKGQVWVMDFFFTNCPSVCPMMNSRMATLNKKYVPAGLRLVSISVDPEHDTPTVLAEYGRKFGAKDDKWLFLTGDKAKIIDLSVKGFKLSADNDPNSHSSRFALIDRNGHIRGYYRSDEEQDIAELEKNITLLLQTN